MSEISMSMALNKEHLSEIRSEEISSLGHYPLAVLHTYDKYGFRRAMELEKRMVPELTDKQAGDYVRHVVQNRKEYEA